MAKNKNSNELEMLRLQITPFLRLVKQRPLAEEVGVKPELVSRVLNGSRTDRYGIIKRAEEIIREERDNLKNQMSKYIKTASKPVAEK